MTRLAWLALVATLGAATSTSAATLTLYNTGQGLSAGASDPHWSVSGPAVSATSAKVLSPGSSYSAWAADTAASSWIGACDCQNTPATPYTFTQAFSLSGYDLSTVVINGTWYIDDTGTLDVNGNLIDTQSDTFSGTGFSVPVADLLPGTNTINIKMTLDDAVLDGVRLQFATTTANPLAVSGAPEPASWALLFAGVGLMGAAFRAGKSRARLA